MSTLGFTPDLEFDGPIDKSTTLRAVRIETLAVLCESLSNVASHAHATSINIRLAAADDQLCLTVRDNGIGIMAADPNGDLHRNIHRRAQQFGGYATMRNAGDNGGTIVEWAVPLASAKVVGNDD